MPLVTVRYCKRVESDITLYYDTFGDSTNPPLLLICGMNMMVPFWAVDFCEKLASYGFFVYRIENRDMGESTHLDHLGTHSICKLACCACCVTPSYTLMDLAADIVAFMDKMELNKDVTIVGQSMGGMIAQHVIDMCEPGRLRSAALIYTTPGTKGLSEPSLKVKLALAKEPKEKTPESFTENWLEMARVAFFKAEVLDKNFEWARNVALTAFKRSMYIGMVTRQASVVVNPEDRTEILKKIKIPCVVIHGEADVLVGQDHGRALAKLIPNSKLVMIKDFAHQVCPDFFQEICDSIAVNAGMMKEAVVEEKKEEQPASATSSTEPTTEEAKKDDAEAVAPEASS